MTLRRMLRLAAQSALLLTATLLSGCAATRPTASEAGQQAWNRQRAALKYELASAELHGGRINEALNLAQEAVGLSPDQPGHAELLARIYMARGDFNSARNVLRAVQSEHPDFGPASYLLGTISERQQNWEAAIAAYGRACEAVPDDLDYRIALVQAVAQTGNTSVALSLLDEHEERFAAEPRFHLVRAEVAEQAGDFPAACDAYRRVLMLGHDDPDVQAALGLCQYWAGRYRQAVQTLDELIKQAKEPEAPLMCAYAGALLRTHQTARAVDWLERFTSQRSDVTQLWVLLAQGRATLGDLNGAVLAAGRAARLSPQSPDVLAVTATTYLAAGKAEAARQTAEYALQFDADNLETLIVLGRACEHLNDRTTARSAYARALELQDSPFVAELLARVSDEQ